MCRKHSGDSEVLDYTFSEYGEIKKPIKIQSFEYLLKFV